MPIFFDPSDQNDYFDYKGGGGSGSPSGPPGPGPGGGFFGAGGGGFQSPASFGSNTPGWGRKLLTSQTRVNLNPYFQSGGGGGFGGGTQVGGNINRSAAPTSMFGAGSLGGVSQQGSGGPESQGAGTGGGLIPPWLQAILGQATQGQGGSGYGLIDSFGSGGRLNARQGLWGLIQQAIQAGAFDPQGSSAINEMIRQQGADQLGARERAATQQATMSAGDDPSLAAFMGGQARRDVAGDVFRGTLGANTEHAQQYEQWMRSILGEFIGAEGVQGGAGDRRNFQGGGGGIGGMLGGIAGSLLGGPFGGALGGALFGSGGRRT